MQEVHIMSRLNHPNILTVLGAAIGRNPPFVIYELMGGGTVEDFLDSKRSKSGTPYAPPT
jgi:serine/threonine protein kinase